MRIAVLVSGGVDSSLALALLAERAEREGLELVAFYLRIWLEDELAFLGECPWEEDLRFVRATTDALGVPLEVVSLQQAYHQRVVAHAIAELAAGRTPSPDVLCNRHIKFGAFVEAVGDGFDRVATGHYARVVRSAEAHQPRAVELHRAPDAIKDQTYFLARLLPEQLAKAEFPIGEMTKREVRLQAARRALPSRDRPDSQGICFLGQIPYPAFVRSHLGDAPGPIVDVESGKVLGTHRGLWFHTIGQRKGLGLGGGPWYVTGKDVAERRLLVTHHAHLRDHARADFAVEALHRLGPPGELERATSVKLRHGSRAAPCTLDVGVDGTGRVRLAETDAGIAPGPVAVFYEGLHCLGSGLIR